MVCISSFLENMDHEFPEHDQIIVPRRAYKVDGKGIKNHCKLNKLKSVDYYELHDKKGFLYVEFSDLVRQDSQLKESASRVKASDLSNRDKTKIRKGYFKKINKELVQKYKDSLMVRTLMRGKIENIPVSFENKGAFIIVVAPINPTLEKTKKVEISRFLETLKDKVAENIPEELYSSVRIVTLDKFIS